MSILCLSEFISGIGIYIHRNTMRTNNNSPRTCYLQLKKHFQISKASFSISSEIVSMLIMLGLSRSLKHRVHPSFHYVSTDQAQHCLIKRSKENWYFKVIWSFIWPLRLISSNFRRRLSLGISVNYEREPWLTQHECSWNLVIDGTMSRICHSTQRCKPFRHLYSQ